MKNTKLPLYFYINIFNKSHIFLLPVPIANCDIIITRLSDDNMEVRWGPCSDAQSLEICPNTDPTNPDPLGDPRPSQLDISDADTGIDRVFQFEGLRFSKKYSVFMRRGDGSLVDSVTRYTGESSGKQIPRGCAARGLKPLPISEDFSSSKNG